MVLAHGLSVQYYVFAPLRKNTLEKHIIINSATFKGNHPGSG